MSYQIDLNSQQFSSRVKDLDFFITIILMQETQQKKWIRAPQNLRLSVPYIKAIVIKTNSNGNAQCYLQTQRGPAKIQVPINQSLEAAEQEQYADMCEMNVLNQPEVLSNIVRRYKKDEIFTSIGPTLIVVNPYRTIDKLFSNGTLERLREKIMINKLGKEVPHVYLIAGKAYISLKESGTKQAIVISGESGAGKTQSTKYCMQLLTSLNYRKNDSIEEKILACNPVLEAFGNSKTVKNQNSSRFGKFVKIYFDDNYSIKGANIHSYLLEKSRVVSVAKNQRNFHSFYAFVASDRSAGKDCSQYHILNQSGCFESTHINDRAYYDEINKALNSIGFLQSEIDQIWSMVECILKLGNINIDETNHLIDESKPCKILNQNHQLVDIARILGIESSHLSKILLFQRKKFLKEFTLSPYNKQGCKANLNTFCKVIYNILFEFILFKIQKSLAPKTQQTNSLKQINILDIFGFQNFGSNNFQQLCINYTNQKLLKLYNNYIFDRQMEILKQDGLEKEIMGILPPTNDQIIQIINGKLSLMSIINDMTLPQFRDEDMIQGFRKINSPFLNFNKLNKHLFKIQHTQAPVEYSISGFKMKNQDKVNDEIMDIVMNLFPNTAKDQAGKTILNKFSKQIDDLINQLNTSSVHFIRCIKPNEQKKPFSPDEKFILTQIRYLGVFQTILIRKNAYPYRKSYSQFRKQFILIFPHLKREKNDQKVAKSIIEALAKNKESYLLGISRIYASSDFEHILNNQIYKFLNLRLTKIKLIQRCLRRCMQIKRILRNLKEITSRITILKNMPCRMQSKIYLSGFRMIKQYSQVLKQREIKKRQQEYQLKLIQMKRQRAVQQQKLQRQKQQKKASSSSLLKLLQLLMQKKFNQILSDSFLLIKQSYMQKGFKNYKQLSLSINQPISDIFHHLNSTQNAGNSAINNNMQPYVKAETPSSDLIGQSLAFNTEFLQSMKTNRHNESKIFEGVLFQGYINIQPFENIPNPKLSILKKILAEKKKMQIEGNEQDFFSPLSKDCSFSFQDLTSEQLSQIIEFPAEATFSNYLRKRTNFLGMKKSYEDILVCKNSALNKSMTVMKNEVEHLKSLKIFDYLLKIGGEKNIENVLNHVEALLQQCQSSSIQLKNEIFVQLIRQANTNSELAAIRICQTMAAYLHVYNPSQDLLRAALSYYYWKFQNKKMGFNEHEYLLYIYSILLRKIKIRSTVGYLPISYQIMGLMCKRQISIPVYMPTGNSILVRVESFYNFSDLKQQCFNGFGINKNRYFPQFFNFYQVINFDNQQLDESPIRQTNMVWDMMTYWELTKSRYQQSGFNPPNFFLMFKVRYIFECSRKDEQTIEIYYSQLFFDYFMGKIILQNEYMYMLAAIIKIAKHPNKEISQIYLGLFPVWFTRANPKEQAIKEILIYQAEIRKIAIDQMQVKYKFIQICSRCELALSSFIPTEEEEGQMMLFLKNKSIILMNKDHKMQIISLKKIVKWSIDKDYFSFQIISEKQSTSNTTIKIRTDYASVCNQYLRNIPLPKVYSHSKEKYDFYKK